MKHVYTKKKIIYAGYVLALLLTWLPMSMHVQVTIGVGDPPQKFSTLVIVSNRTEGLRLPHLTTAERNAMEATTEFQAQNHRGGCGQLYQSRAWICHLQYRHQLYRVLER